MNIVCIPYHDWRKIEEEGARTRDAHIIENLYKKSNINKILVINRPITLTEILLKNKKYKLKGEIVFKYRNSELYKINEKIYVLDFLSSDIIGPIIYNKKWFFNCFEKLQKVFKKSLDFLNMKPSIIFSQNIFSAKFLEIIDGVKVFDAWDNFLLFPSNQKWKNDFKEAYISLSKSCDVWITNSEKNIEFYNQNYSPKNTILINNGVDFNRFSEKYAIPKEFHTIKKPIIGFGGKISHMIDYELYNYITDNHKDKSFVLIGQILDKEVFKKINKNKNVFYLGDKPYDEYLKYMTNFDVGIIPYMTDDLEHGADTIKVYEYLAANLGVVGTKAAGMIKLSDYVFLSEDKESFSYNIDKALEPRNQIELPAFYSWAYKVDLVTSIFEKLINEHSNTRN